MLLETFINLYLKEASEHIKRSDVELYAWVPVASIPMVQKYGLMAGRALLNHPDAIKNLSQALDISPMSIRHSIHSAGVSHLGPKVVFSEPPKNIELSSNHPSKIAASALIAIDYKKLKEDEPEVRLWGMEIPSGDMGLLTNRYLSYSEVDYYMKLSPNNLWSSYYDEENKGMFAPSVPHARIEIEGQTIDPMYLRIV